MKLPKLNILLLIALGATTANATLKNDKITLKNNMIVKYNKTPKAVDTIGKVFSEGEFYGRLRSNMFYFDWQNEDDAGDVKDNRALGLGGSFIYKTASYLGFSATAGLYTSQNPTWYREDRDDIKYLKSGKDTLSRYDVDESGTYGMTVLAQAYLQYNIAKTTIVGGRQLFESVWTKSNDTKMIPNTFDGVSVVIKDIPNTTIKIAWLDSQKLRDHTRSHDVLAYNPNDKWKENDDSAVNKNLTVDRIGDNNDLDIISITNKSIKNLKLDIGYAMVPTVLGNFVAEANYIIPIGNFKIVPGIRYMQQFDYLNADYEVANLSGNQQGYDDKDSLDTNMIATRVDFKTKALLFRVAYSQVADEADIVTPWRGFPTGGYTRAMGQYNWRANTKTYLVKIAYDFDKAKLLNGFSIMAQYAIQDFDDDKDGVQADSNILHVDLRQNIAKNLQAKIRMGFCSVDDGIKKSDNITYKKDTSYNEYRFELNYFF